MVNAYLIPFGGLLLLAGRLGDLAGRKRIFLAGLAVFTAASLLCGCSSSQGMLIAARFGQGAGAAMTSAVILGMIVAAFPEPRERATAIAMYSFAGAAGASVGAGRRAAHPGGQLALDLLCQRAGRHRGHRRGHLLIAPDRGLGLRAGADVAGAILVTAALMLGVYTIVEAAGYGWLSAHTLGYGGAATALLAAFGVREARAARPLMPLRIIRTGSIGAANLIQALMVAGMLGFQFVIPLYLRRVLGYDPAETGLSFLPITVVIGLISVGGAARLCLRFGARAVLLVSMPLLAAGLAALTRAPLHGNYAVFLLPVMIVLGTGAGLALTAITMLAMSGAAPADSGLASGLVNTTQQVGGALGVAILATLAAGRTSQLTHTSQLADPHVPTVAALASGYHLAFGVGAAFIAAGFVLAATLLRPAGPAAATGETGPTAATRETGPTAATGEAGPAAAAAEAGLETAAPARCAESAGSQPCVQ